MSDNNLNLTNVISIAIQGAPQQLSQPNINTAALFSAEGKPAGWGGSQEHAIYTRASDVGADFGTNSNAYKVAVAFFSQQPNPLLTGGYLAIVPRTPGSPMETVQAAIIRMQDKVYFFGVLVDEQYTAIGATFIALTAFIQTLDKVMFYCTNNASEFDPGGMVDGLRTGAKTQVRGLFHSVKPMEFAAAYAGAALSTDFGGSNTARTMHLKVLNTILPDPAVNQTVLASALAAGVDTYVQIAGLPSCFTSGANTFFDSIYNRFWLKFALQTAGFNFMRSVGSKIPQTESGIEALKNEYRKVCEQGVANGFLGRGSWTSPDTFGDSAALVRNITDVGYYVYSQPITRQLQADRSARKAPLIQIAVKEQGAIHSSSVIVSVNI